MEIRKFIGAALMAAAICTGFASCSNDDDKEGDPFDSEIRD